MLDEIVLAHHQSLGHPVQELEVGAHIQVHELGNLLLRLLPRALPAAEHVPFREVDSIIRRLDLQERKCQQKEERAGEVHQRRRTNLFQRIHF